MKKYKKGVISLIITVMCMSSLSQAVSASDNELQGNEEPMSYVIYDAEGNIQSEGYMPINETEGSIQTLDSWGARTIGSNGYMYLYRTSDNFPFYLAAGSHVSMQFGLNRNALITSAIVRNPGQFIAHASGLTGGRTHSTIVQQSGDHHGYIYNTDSSPVTVTYANFNTAY